MEPLLACLDACTAALRGHGWEAWITATPAPDVGLVQAVSNLVRNAVEHSGAGARVVVRLLDREDTVELSVWNEGELAVTDMGALFDPFRKGTESRGLGLGLYISQRIARAHGGELTVSSAPGAGTTFLLRVPFAPPDALS